MRPTFLGFEVGKKSIMSSQKALDIVGNNLANQETTGYTRQRVDLVSIASRAGGLRYNTITSKNSLSGQGVSSPGVQQIRDPFLDKRYRENSAYLAENETTASVLNDIENLIGKTNVTNLSDLMDKFKSALSNYADDPTSEENATIVRASAQNITLLLRTNSTKLDEVTDQAVLEMSANVDYVNTIAKKIAAYNKQIKDEYVVSKNTFYGPNELLDQRNLLLDQLSTYGNSSITTHDDGTVTVKFGGVDIVKDEKTIELVMEDYYKNGEAILKFSNGSDSTNLTTGSLKSYLEVLNGASSYAVGNQSAFRGIPYYKGALNEFANRLSELMNNANGSAMFPERALFASSTEGKISASTIVISDYWTQNARMIGEKYDTDSNSYLSTTLDNTNVQILQKAFGNELKFGNMVIDFKGSIEKYLQSITNNLAQDIEYKNGQAEAVNSTVNDILDSRNSISAINTDEEGINMLNFQKWLNASSRLVTTLDEALDRIINGMGRVGV